VIWAGVTAALLAGALPAREIHVSVKGDDRNAGTAARPLKTISAAAKIAQPGDVVTVHEGTYRERVTPPRGGASDARRIVYQAAKGEAAVIKGSEVVRDWKPVQAGVWKVTLPNSFFGSYNPYKDLIVGDWFTDKGRPHHTGEVYLNGKSLFETNLLERVMKPQPYPDARDKAASMFTWYTEGDAQATTIWANFGDKDPNKELVEINVRDSCFYPDQPGRDYITIRGFRMAQAATQWAAPTAEQIGLIGTHFSKGWIVENNEISDSKCSGITLGKERGTGHNVWINDPSKDGAIHYVEVIERALKIGWSKEKTGGHIVRNNAIHDCEQTGIAGSLGAVFSRIENNHIYNIWAKRQFTGAEMAGIKLHAAIDVVIEHNRIHNAGRGLWMDWMAQGTRISRNLLYDNTTDDLFVEVDHGPFLVDNNLFLSPVSLRDWSEGGAYVHNLMTGRILNQPEPNRRTPFHKAHSTELAGLVKTTGGDDRFYNNLFVGGADANETKGQQRNGYGTWVYDTREYASYAGGNIYVNGAKPYAKEPAPLVIAARNGVKLVDNGATVEVRLNLPAEALQAATQRVTTALLGQAKVPGVGYENPDGKALAVDQDFLGKKRDGSRPTPGPFERPGAGELTIKVW
jgi:hypothetical protein